MLKRRKHHKRVSGRAGKTGVTMSSSRIAAGAEPESTRRPARRGRAEDRQRETPEAGPAGAVPAPPAMAPGDGRSWGPLSPAAVQRLQQTVGNQAVQRYLQQVALPEVQPGPTVQRDHHRTNPRRMSVDYGQITDTAMKEAGESDDESDVDYDDAIDGWEFPDDHSYGEPRQVFPWTRPGFTAAVKKHILQRDLGNKCPLCKKPLIQGVKYLTQKGKIKIDSLDIDHYNSDWIVRLGKLKDYYRLHKATNDIIRASVVEAYNDYNKSATIPGAGGYLRLTHAPCNRSRPKSS
jgi:hypothetical protein